MNLEPVKTLHRENNRLFSLSPLQEMPLDAMRPNYKVKPYFYGYTLLKSLVFLSTTYPNGENAAVPVAGLCCLVGDTLCTVLLASPSAAGHWGYPVPGPHRPAKTVLGIKIHCALSNTLAFVHLWTGTRVCPYFFGGGPNISLVGVGYYVLYWCQ